MAELIEIGEQQERVILFAASTNASDDTEESVEELRELVKTAGAETASTRDATATSILSRISRTGKISIREHTSEKVRSRN